LVTTAPAPTIAFEPDGDVREDDRPVADKYVVADIYLAYGI
jgi:hypothetical protein